MTDIVERLHNLSDDLNAHPVGELWAGLDEAADEIERLRTMVEKLRAERDALKAKTMQAIVKAFDL
jgi:archaellum component FlaC